ncbi:MAG: peptidylprolyl isomerase [Bacteroidota bacterium]|nr:peptidylprolyl isomerase [Bacteroidota bacterium]
MKNYVSFSLIAVWMIFCACQSSKSSERTALIETSLGNMKVKLYDSTPKHRDNFIKLVESGFYNDLLFHRVISGFMIQGGDPDSKNASPEVMLGAGGPGYTIDAEFGKYHFKGALAAARQGDQINPQKKSSGSQFYITQGQRLDPSQLSQLAAQKGITYTQEEINKYTSIGGTPFLDGDYTVFGEVIEGLETLDKIAAVQNNAANRPFNDIRMKIKML